MAFVQPDGSRMVALVVGTGPKARSLSMFERMHALGLSTVIVSDVGSWVHEMESTGIVHKVIVVPGLSKLPQDKDLAQAVVEALYAAALGRVTGVYNCYNKYLLLTSLVAERLDVITNSYESVRRCVFKNETRACLTAAGLEPWKSFFCSTTEELEQATQQIAFPAILKPAKGSGSVGVVKVFSPEEAHSTLAEQLAKRGIENEVFLLEEYIDGPEFGVEIVMQNGKVLFCSVMDATKQTYGQFFQGTGRSYPTAHGSFVEALMRAHCIAAVYALGLTTGVFDMDVRYSPQCGVRILEVNARMGGGSVQKMHEHVYGLDLVETHLRTCMGLSVEYLASMSPREPTMWYEAGWLESPYSGVVSGVGVEAFTSMLREMYADHPNVLEFVPLCADGEKVTGNKVPGLPSSLIMVFTKGAQKGFAEQHLAAVLCSAEERIADLVQPNSPQPMQLPVSAMAPIAVTAVVGSAVMGTAAALAVQLVEQVLSPTARGMTADFGIPGFAMEQGLMPIACGGLVTGCPLPGAHQEVAATPTSTILQ